MELFLLIIESSIFIISEKNHVFIEEVKPSSKAVTMEEELDAVKENRMGNLVM